MANTFTSENFQLISQELDE